MCQLIFYSLCIICRWEPCSCSEVQSFGMDGLRLVLGPEHTDEFFTVSIVKHKLLLCLVYSVVAESYSGKGYDCSSSSFSLYRPLCSHPYENMNDFFVFIDMPVLLLISVVKIGSLTFYQLFKIPPFYNLVRKFVCRWLLFSSICLWKTEWKKYFRMECSRLCSSILSFCLCRGRNWHLCFTSLYVPHWVGLSKEACLLIMSSYMETAMWWWLCILLAHWL